MEMQIKKFLVETLGLALNYQNLSNDYRSVAKVTSLDLLMIAIALEEEFGIAIAEDRIPSCLKDVDSIAEYVRGQHGIALEQQLA